MDSVVTPTDARKHLFELLRKVNDDQKPVLIKPTKAHEKGAVVISEADWDAIQETLFLIDQGVDKQIRDRQNDKEEDFDAVWEQL